MTKKLFKMKWTINTFSPLGVTFSKQRYEGGCWSVPTLLGSATNLGQVSQLTRYNFDALLYMVNLPSLSSQPRSCVMYVQSAHGHVMWGPEGWGHSCLWSSGAPIAHLEDTGIASLSLGAWPSGNLHLSAAVYLSGASFIQIEKVNDMQL